MTEVGANLFSTLEEHCRMAADGHRSFSSDTSLLQEQCRILCESLNNTVELSASSDAQSTMQKDSITTLRASDYKVASRLSLSRFSSLILLLFLILTLGSCLFLPVQIFQ